MSELSRETKELLERGRRGRSLTSDRRARLKRAVLAEAAVVAVVATTTTAAAWTVTVAKIVGVVVLLGVAGAGIAVVVSRSHDATTTDAVGTRSSTSQPTSPPTRLEVPSAPIEPAPTSEPAPVLAPSAEAPKGAALPPHKPALSSSASVEEEARLLREADRALKGGDADAALGILTEHAKRFRRGVLEPERSAERVFALCQAGRTEKARAEADAFLKAHPSGPLAVRVSSSCGGR